MPPKGERHPLSAEAIVDGLMQKADTIRSAYARTLQQQNRGALRPESDLPASKEEIKAALLLCAIFLKNAGSLDSDTSERFQFCYACLGDFVADAEKAKRSRRFADLVLEYRSVKPEDIDPIKLAKEVIALDLSDVTAGRSESFARLSDEFGEALTVLSDPKRGRAERQRLMSVLMGTTQAGA